MTHTLDYTFLRTEADNQIIMFIKASSMWLEKEADINLTSKKELSIQFENEDNYLSEPLPLLLYEHLTTKSTSIVLCDNDMNFLAKFILSPLPLPQEEMEKTMSNNSMKGVK
jgi:hypothetical protein